MFFMFVSSAVKWTRVLFCRLGKTGPAIWLLHNLGVWINIPVDKYNVDLKLRSLLLAACRQFSPPAALSTLHQHQQTVLGTTTFTCRHMHVSRLSHKQALKDTEIEKWKEVHT